MKTNSYTADPLEPLGRPFGSIGRYWTRRAYGSQVALVALFLVFKNGFDVELRNIQEAYLPGSLIFPDPVGYYSASFGQVLFANILNLDETGSWVVAHFALTVLVFVAATWLILRGDNYAKGYMLLVLAAATATASVMISIGKYDIFTFAGGVFLVLARSNWAAALGALILASGNPEQAILASLSLLVLTQLEAFRKLRFRSMVALAISVFSWTFVQIWFVSSGLDLGRISLIPVFLGESLSNFATAPLKEIWAWLGIGWVIVLAALVLSRGKERALIFLSLIAIPAAATVITADGARVFGAIVLPSFLVLGGWIVSVKVEPSKYAKQALGVFLVLLIFVPTTLEKPGWYDGQLRGRIMSVTENIIQR